MQWWVSGFFAVVLASSFATAKVDFSRLERFEGRSEIQTSRLTDADLRRTLQARASKNHHSLGYKGARQELLGRISLERDNAGHYMIRDVYCEKDYDQSEFGGSRGPGPGRIPDDRVLNTEHTWPQSRFGGQDRDKQKSDLHHLFPSDSELNGIRGNHPFGEVHRNERSLKCTCSRAGYDSNGNFVFEPPEAHRGNVARALFYFAVRYGMKLDSDQEQVLKKWNQQDPVDQDEIIRNDEIEKIQGNRNPFIDEASLADQISDF